MSEDIINELLKYAEKSVNDQEIVSKLHSGDIPKLIIHEEEIEDNKSIEGLDIKADKTDDGFINVLITIKEGHKIEKPLYLCFGVLSPAHEQKINMKVIVEDNAEAKAYAFCTFPKSVKVIHIMKAEYKLGKNSRFSYDEFHYHGHLGAEVKSYTEAELADEAQLSTSFTLTYGTVGNLDYRVKSKLNDKAKFVAVTKVEARDIDKVYVDESAELNGKESAAVLKSRLLSSENSKANFIGTVIGRGDNSRGHVDCKEILMDNGIAETTPQLKVVNKTARLTHEAAIGSVDRKEIQTLEARGLSKEEATDLIVRGMMK